MEGTGKSSNGQAERTAARLLLDIDLNRELVPEPEEAVHVPNDDSPIVVNPSPPQPPPAVPHVRVTLHSSEKGDPKEDVLIDINKLNKNDVDMVNSTKMARAGKNQEEMRGDGAEALAHAHGNVVSHLKPNRMDAVGTGNSSAKKSHVPANNKLTGPEQKRARTSTTQSTGRIIGSPEDAAPSTAVGRCVLPPKLKWKTMYDIMKKGDAQVQKKSSEQHKNP